MKINKLMRALFGCSMVMLVTLLARAQSSVSTPGGTVPYHVSQVFHVGGEGE